MAGKESSPERRNESKRSGVKRIRLLPGSPLKQKRLKIHDFQILEQNDSNYRRNQQTSQFKLAEPKQDKSLGNYLINAVEEIKQLEEICRNKRHSILALKERQNYLSRAHQTMMGAKTNKNQYGGGGGGSSKSLEYGSGEFNDIEDTNKNGIIDRENHCLMEPFSNDTSQSDMIFALDQAEDIQNKNVDYQTNQLANQTHESITWFPEYIEMNSSTTTDHDETLQDFPSYNEMLTNDNACTHVSVIKLIKTQ